MFTTASHIRASSARSMHSLSATPFAGSPANGRRKRREGGPALRPARAPDTQQAFYNPLLLYSSYSLYSLDPHGQAFDSTVTGGSMLTSNSKKIAESGSFFDGTLSVAGGVVRALARTPGSLHPAVTVAGRTGLPTEDALSWYLLVGHPKCANNKGKSHKCWSTTCGYHCHNILIPN